MIFVYIFGVILWVMTSLFVFYTLCDIYRNDGYNDPLWQVMLVVFGLFFVSPFVTPFYAVFIAWHWVENKFKG